MTQSTPSQASFTLPTARLPSPEPVNVLSRSTPTPPVLNLPTNQPSAPTSTSSPALLTVPVSPADHAPNTMPITDNPPHILPAIPLAGAEYLNASHSVFNSAGRDIYNIHHHYQPISGSNLPKRDAASADKEPHVSYQQMPCHNELFTGREDCLERLRQFFVPRHESSPRRSFLVYGMGGAGKSQLCLKFVEGSEQFWGIFWVDATNAETMELSLQDLASDPDARASGVERSAKSVLLWLSRIQNDWLLVFDNVDGDYNRVAEYMPRGNRGNILFNSRNPNLARFVSRDGCLEVENMEEEDAILLLLRSSWIDDCTAHSRQAARLIVEELCCLPLAVDQAGAAIASGLCSLDDYLLMYSQRRQALLADPVFRGASNYGRAVYGTFDLSFTAIKHMDTEVAERAILILQTFAFFHHQNIAEDIIKRAVEATGHHNNESVLQLQLLHVDQKGRWDSLYFREGIRILLSFSLVKKAAISGVYSMHPLVHCWSRDSMTHHQQQNSSSVVLSLLSSSITFKFTSDDYKYRQTLIPHIKAIKEYTAGMENQMPYNDQQYTNFGLVFKEAGNWKEAEELEVQIMQTRKRVLGEEHLDTLISKANLAAIYRNKGQWKEAEELEVQVMQTRKRVLGEENPFTLASMGNLASTYKIQGQWKGAEELEVQVMQTSLKVLGKEHPSTLTSMGSLALTYWNQGQWKEAEELGVQVMQTSLRVLGKEHPSTLTSMVNLASTYRNQGRWKEAEDMEVPIVQTRKRVLGEEHPDTLASMANLALTYWNQGRWKEAEELGFQNLQTSLRVLGEEHPFTLTSMGNLASTYWNQGRWKEAEELEVQVMHTRKRVLGEEHPSTLTVMANLASTYRDQGRWKEAEELGVQVMKTSLRVLGKEHPSTLIIIENLALTYRNQERWKEAEELDIQVMQTRKKMMEDVPEVGHNK